MNGTLLLERNIRVMRREEVTELVGVSNVTLWRWERDGRFPLRRQIGPNVVGWLSYEIEEWLLSRPTIGGG